MAICIMFSSSTFSFVYIFMKPKTSSKKRSTSRNYLIRKQETLIFDLQFIPTIFVCTILHKTSVNIGSLKRRFNNSFHRYISNWFLKAVTTSIFQIKQVLIHGIDVYKEIPQITTRLANFVTFSDGIPTRVLSKIFIVRCYGRC